MPVYEYEAVSPQRNCPKCVRAFEVVQSIHDARLEACPACGAPIRKCIVAPALGRSKSMLDDRAKSAGFSKLKKIGKGEYEKLY